MVDAMQMQIYAMTNVSGASCSTLLRFVAPMPTVKTTRDYQLLLFVLVFALVFALVFVLVFALITLMHLLCTFCARVCANYANALAMHFF